MKDPALFLERRLYYYMVVKLAIIPVEEVEDDRIIDFYRYLFTVPDDLQVIGAERDGPRGRLPGYAAGQILVRVHMGDPGFLLDIGLQHVKTGVRRDEHIRRIETGGQE